MTIRDSIISARIPGAAFEFRFKASDPTFAGHFPGHPILPGVFQLEMTRSAAEWTLNCALEIREVAKAKFQRPILPEESVRLELKLSETGGVIDARGIFTVAGERAGETMVKLCRSK